MRCGIRAAAPTRVPAWAPNRARPVCAAPTPLLPAAGATPILRLAPAQAAPIPARGRVGLHAPVAAALWDKPVVAVRAAAETPAQQPVAADTAAWAPPAGAGLGADSHARTEREAGVGETCGANRCHPTAGQVPPLAAAGPDTTAAPVAAGLGGRTAAPDHLVAADRETVAERLRDRDTKPPA